MSMATNFLVDYGSTMPADIIVGDGVSLINTNANIKLKIQPTASDIARLAWGEYQQRSCSACRTRFTCLS